MERVFLQYLERFVTSEKTKTSMHADTIWNDLEF